MFIRQLCRCKQTVSQLVPCLEHCPISILSGYSIILFCEIKLDPMLLWSLQSNLLPKDTVSIHISKLLFIVLFGLKFDHIK